MLITIDNITWNFQSLSDWDEESLGLGYVGIPPQMLKEFIEECCWDDCFPVPPHYDKYDGEHIHFDGEHECYNTDTQIVLMNWLHDKESKYKLTYRGEDPFWLFHDNRHSHNDVYGSEVGPIYSYTEYQRILEGAEMAKHYGIYIKPKTVAGILNDWKQRFQNREGTSYHTISEKDFYPLMKKKSINEIQFYY